MLFDVAAFKGALSATADPVLRQTLQCLAVHCHPEWGDSTPLDVLCRLLAKNIRPSGWTKFTHAKIHESQILSRAEVWTLEALSSLPRGHGDASGEDGPCPIVIAEVQGTQRLLDGNHRINRCLKSGTQHAHLVNVHLLTGNITYVEQEGGKHGA
jgi:hypothetical protein